MAWFTGLGDEAFDVEQALAAWEEEAQAAGVAAPSPEDTTRDAAPPEDTRDETPLEDTRDEAQITEPPAAEKQSEPVAGAKRAVQRLQSAFGPKTDKAPWQTSSRRALALAVAIQEKSSQL